MSPLVLSAPAKINLALRVLGKRDDGYHEIDTLMVRLPGLADRLEFSAVPEFCFTCDDPSLPIDEGNLVVRAVRAYEQAANCRCSHALHLTKVIPHGAGLGGGSSDAAAALSGLNQLHGGLLDPARLHAIAASLGSDVPFFLGGPAARCHGRGEHLEAAEPPAPLRVLLLKPSFAVATPDAYRRWSGSRELPGVSYGVQEISGLSLINDLERPVFAKHRFLAELKTWLLAREETAAALLCGSGSTMFAVLREGADAIGLAKAARHELDPGLWHWTGTTATG